MGSREKDQTTPHQPLLSSLVVRPTDSGGGGGSDYEPGEVRRDPPPSYSRSDRFPENRGYRMRAGSTSPVRRRNGGLRDSPEFDHSSGPPRNRGFGRGRDPGRYRDYSPPYGRGRTSGGRFSGRGFDGPRMGPRGEGLLRNSPNVRPREGDWMCTDPSCNNLNFARRESCNKCNRPRFSTGASPRRGHPGPPPPFARRFPGPPLDRSPPGRSFNNGYRSPPRGFAKDGPRDFGIGGPPHPRHEGRFPRDRPNYLDDDFRERNRFDRSAPLPDWGRDRPLLGDRKGGYERRPLSPPLPPHQLPMRGGGGGGRWGDERERSRSPIRGGPPPPSKDYRRDMYLERGRDDRRGGMGRDDRRGGMGRDAF